MTPAEDDRPGSGMHGRLRIGDAERDRAVAALREHHAAGRLDFVELEERLAGALGARTAAQLDPLFADLPELTSARTPPRPSPPRRRRPPRRLRWVMGVLAALFGILMALVSVGEEEVDSGYGPPGTPAEVVRGEAAEADDVEDEEDDDEDQDENEDQDDEDQEP